MMLDSSSLGFRSALGALDRMPTRFCDTAFVVYCHKGQHRVEDILANQVNRIVSIIIMTLVFLDFTSQQTTGILAVS